MNILEVTRFFLKTGGLVAVMCSIFFFLYVSIILNCVLSEVKINTLKDGTKKLYLRNLITTVKALQ